MTQVARKFPEGGEGKQCEIDAAGEGRAELMDDGRSCARSPAKLGQESTAKGLRDLGFDERVWFAIVAPT